MSPLIPLIILLVGTGALLFGLLPRFRYTGLVAIGTAGLALLALLVMAFRLPAGAVLSQWGPASLLPLGPRLAVDPLAWLFGVAVLILTLATLLTGVARPGGRRIIVRGAMLLLAFAGLASFFADNLITRVLAWAGLDLIYFLALILLARDEGMEPQAVLNLAFNATGTLLALAAALMISRTSEALSLRDAALSPQSTVLITLAAMFRLGLFPLHLGLPAEAHIRQGLGALLRLIPAAVALEVVGRLAVFGFTDSVRPWLILFGVVAAVVGAAQLWNMEDPRLGITYIVIAESGLSLLAGLWRGEQTQPAAALMGQSLALMLGSALIFLSNGHDKRRPLLSGLPLLGAAAMLGAPLTLGFMGARGLYGGSFGAGNWGVLVGVALAQVILAAGCLRTVFWPGPAVEGEPLLRLAYFGGLALPAIFLVVAGVLGAQISAALAELAPGFFTFSEGPSMLALALVLITTAAGSGLWYFENAVRARADVVGRALTSLFRLDWLYRLVWGAIRLLGAAIFNLGEVMEGEGAILWTLVAALLVWLLFR